KMYSQMFFHNHAENSKYYLEILPESGNFCAMNELTFSYPQLRQFAFNSFRKMNCPEADARLAADVLLSADLRGIDSHGVARLSGYVRLWEAKRINSNPTIKIVHETPSTAVVDGDSGLGLVVAPK